MIIDKRKQKDCFWFRILCIYIYYQLLIYIRLIILGFYIYIFQPKHSSSNKKRKNATEENKCWKATSSTCVSERITDPTLIKGLITKMIIKLWVIGHFLFFFSLILVPLLKISDGTSVRISLTSTWHMWVNILFDP